MTLRKTRTPRLGVALLVVLSGVMLAAAPASGQRIVSAEGPVEVGSGDPPIWRGAEEGDLLAPGDAVRTGRGGRAEVQLRTGSVRVFENSLLRLPADAPAAGQSERVRLKRGTSIFDVLRRSAEDLFEVETPEVAVMVKGTRFTVSVADGLTNVAVYRGLVGVRHLAETLEAEVLVRAGFALAGTLDGPFELVVNPAADPWNGWSVEIAPPVPSAALEAPALLRARRAAVEAADRDLTKRLLEARPELARQALRNARKPKQPKVKPLGSLQPATDPVVDPETLSTTIQEEFAETFVEQSSGLPGWDVTKVTSGGPNFIQVTAPSGTWAGFDKTQLQWIIQNNSGALFYPELQNALTNAGMAPAVFGAMLYNML